MEPQNKDGFKVVSALSTENFAEDGGVSVNIPNSALSNYFCLMTIVRERFDLIEKLNSLSGDDFSRAETAAFHGRKIVESIAFACLVATDNGLKYVPKDAKGHWSAEVIFKSLIKKKIHVFPMPCRIIFSNTREDNVLGGLEDIPSRRLTHEKLISIYQNLHRWLHEINPYVSSSRDAFFNENSQQLWSDLLLLKLFIEKHLIEIRGEAFFCILKDGVDNQTKVISLSGN